MLKKIIQVYLCLCILMIPLFVFAQSQGSDTGAPSARTTNSVSEKKLTNPLKDGIGDNFISLLSAILERIVMPVMSVVVVCYIIYAGFTYVMAGGNPTEVSKAHQRLLWALVGAGILLGAVGISKAVQNTVTQVINPNAINSSQ